MERIDKVIELENGRNFLLESDFEVDGFRCVVIGQSIGHRCGYVAIPATHKLYGVKYEDLYALDVHGGLTYSEHTYGGNYPTKSEDSTWWLGFDCGHWGDGKDFTLMELLLDERTYNNLLEIEKHFDFYEREEVRTNEYVVEELIKLVNQIK